ncbi:MAG TPA: SIMPL domain-containing protein [Stenomitos sp.]
MFKQYLPPLPKHKPLWPLGAIAVFAIGYTGLTALAPVAQAQERPVSLSSSTQMLRTLTVTGQCTEKIPATLADVQLGVETQGKTAQQVQEEVARRSSAVVALLKSRGVEKLQTTGINLNPQYSYTNNKQTLIGYQASNTVSFRIIATQAGTLMDDAVRAGASRIDNISFVASDAAIADAQKVALRKATQDAQSQANAVLESIGLKAREIVSIQLNGANTPPPMPYRMTMKAAPMSADAASSPVEAGEQSVQASVTLQISY